MNKPEWCKIKDHLYMIEALILKKGIVCDVCKIKHQCYKDTWYSSGTPILTIQNKIFLPIKIVNKLPTHPLHCNHCNKDSAKIVSYGAVREREYGYQHIKKNYFMVQCKECNHRWSLTVESYQNKFKRKWKEKF